MPVKCCETARLTCGTRHDDDCPGPPPRTQLEKLARELGDDELRVLVYMAERLKRGEADYGPLELSKDRRDFEAEAIEEDADGAIYRACDRIRRKLRG